MHGFLNTENGTVAVKEIKGSIIYSRHVQTQLDRNQTVVVVRSYFLACFCGVKDLRFCLTSYLLVLAWRAYFPGRSMAVSEEK